MAPEEGNSPSHPHHQRRPPHRYSGSKVDSEQYYHNPFYYRTHRNRPAHFKNGGDTSGGFSFNHEALDNSEILYENADEPILSDSDIPQFHIPRPPKSLRKDKKKEEDNYPMYRQTYLQPHHREPPRGRDRRPRPNTNNPWPHHVPPPPLVPQNAALSSSTTSSQQKPGRRKEPVTGRFSATASAAPTHLPRSGKIPLHYVAGHEPPDRESDLTSSPPPPQGRRRRLSPPLFPLPAPTTTVDGGSVLMAGRGEKRSAGLKRGARMDYNDDRTRDPTSGGPLASDSPSPIRSFVPDGYEGGSDELLPPEPTEVNGTELSLSLRKRNSGGGDGSLLYDGGSGGYDEEGYEGYGYEYVGPDYDGEEVIMVSARGKGHEGLWSPGWEVSSVRTFSDGGRRDDEEEGTSELIAGMRGRGRGFFDYARARARRKGERERGATGHHVPGLGDDGESDQFGIEASLRGRGGLETAGGGGGWETEPEPYLFNDEDFGGDIPRGWPPGRIERVDYERGEEERARDKRKSRRKKHSDSNRTSTPPALPNGPAPPSVAGPLSTIRAPRTPSEVAGCALGTAAVGLCATGVKKVVSQAIKWEVEKQVQERLWEERMERKRRRARKREEKEKNWRERDRLEREAIVAGRASGRPGFARRLSDKVPQRFKRAMSGPSGPSDLSKANERRDKDWPPRDDAVELESSDPIGGGFCVEDEELSPKLRRGWRRGWSRSRTPEPRRPFPRWSRPPEEPWRRGGGSGFHDPSH